MDSLLTELKRDILDSSVPLSNALRKALGLARQLKASEIEKWINLELGGYQFPEKEAVVAPYRNYKGELIANTIMGRITLPDMPGAGEVVQEGFLPDSIGLIEDFLKETSVVAVPLSPENQAALAQVLNLRSKFFIKINRVDLLRIIEGARNKLLAWVLELEALEQTNKSSLEEKPKPNNKEQTTERNFKLENDYELFLAKKFLIGSDKTHYYSLGVLGDEQNFLD